jgi:hypothetical protein
MHPPLRCRRLAVVAAVALALGVSGLGGSAAAVSIVSTTVTLNAGNSADQFDDLVQISRIRQSSASVLVNNAASFATRYALMVGTDIGNAQTQTVSHTADYTVTLQISALLNEMWQLDVTSSWAGALTLRNDGTGPASVTLNGVTGAHAGAGLLSGSLSLAAVGTLSSNAGGDQPFSSSALATILGTGTGGIQTVTMNFTWTASSTSTRGGGPGSNRGDEGALRMGIDTGMSSYTADNYPGGPGNPPARVIANDGHHVAGVIISLGVPEPHPLLLLCAGMLGLAVFGRRR